ncbi:glycosyltransferase family 4 protein [Neobacillus sp. K501]
MSKIKKIYINGRFLSQKLTGVQRVAIELTKQLDLINGLNVTILLPKNAEISIGNFKNIKIKKVGFLKGHLWEQIELPFYCTDGFLLNFCNTAPILKKMQTVIIHDAAVFSVPNAYSITFRIWYKFLFSILFRKLKIIITDSHFSKRELVKHLKVEDEKISIISLGKDHFSQLNANNEVVSKYNLIQPYFFAVSSLHPNKNFKVILQAIELLDIDTFEIVIAGGANPKIFHNSINMDQDKVKYLGYVSDEDLKGLYKNAFAFIFPSIYEGFGLPPIEAMDSGCPVIASTYASIPEVCGEAAIYFDPKDPSDLADKMIQLLSNENLHSDLKRRGLDHSNKYTWDLSLQKLLEVLNIKTR